MKINLLTICLFIMCGFIMLLTTGCGAKYMVKGQVVDAENGNPIKGAAIVICWVGHKFFSPYTSGAYTIETAEDLSDENGIFQIPKYALKTYDMGVYKKGYVCWDSEDIFLKDTLNGHYFKKRKGFNIENGMVIKLELFTEEYSREQHAHFTNAVSVKYKSPYNGVFRKATESEILLHDKLLKGKWRK